MGTTLRFWRVLLSSAILMGMAPAANAAAPANHAVYFDFNSAALSPAGKATLDRLVEEVSDSTNVAQLIVHGTSDLAERDGANETADYYNATLAHTRAKAVQQYLSQHVQIPVKEGAIRTFDKETYDDHCATLSKTAMLACKEKGRRVEIEFIHP